MFVHRTTGVLAAVMVAAPAVLGTILPNTCSDEPFVPNTGGVITFW